MWTLLVFSGVLVPDSLMDIDLDSVSACGVQAAKHHKAVCSLGSVGGRKDWNKTEYQLPK